MPTEQEVRVVLPRDDEEAARRLREAAEEMVNG